MSKRRPARRQATRRSAQKGQGRLLLFGLGLGLAVGLFVALLVYLDDQPAPALVRQAAPPYDRGQASQPAPEPEPEPAEPAAEEPRYEFYTVLPKMEVYVPEPERVPDRKESASASRNAAPEAVAPVEQPGAYLLQVGSFRKHGQADRLKASLALLGIESTIQTVRIDDGSTWHRVQVGPYKDLNRLNQVRAQLRENDIPAMLLKLQS